MKGDNKFTGHYKQVFAEIRDSGTTVGTSLWMTQSALDWQYDGGQWIPGRPLATAQSSAGAISTIISLTTRDEATLDALKNTVTAYQGGDTTGNFAGFPTISPQGAQTINGIVQGQQFLQQMTKANQRLYTWNRTLEYELVNDSKYQTTITMFYFTVRKDFDMDYMRHNYQSVADIDLLCSHRRYARQFGNASDQTFIATESMPEGNQGYLGETITKQNAYPDYHNHIEWTPFRSTAFTRHFKVYKVKKINMAPGSILKFKQSDKKMMSLDPRTKYDTQGTLLKAYLRGAKGVIFKSVGQALSGNVAENNTIVTTAPTKMTLKTIYSMKYRNVATQMHDKFWALTSTRQFRTSGTKSATDQFDVFGDTEIGAI